MLLKHESCQGHGKKIAYYAIMKRERNLWGKWTWFISF